MWYIIDMSNMIQLNSQQQQAVLDTEGAVLVIAGAGSGKTRVLSARICHLLDEGVSPYNILAITFTNKAAGEMKDRIERTSGCTGVWASTFHSMCAKMLRLDVDKLGYGKDFTIYTEVESDRVLKRIMADVPSADPKKKSEYLWHISRAKTNAMDPREYFSHIDGIENDAQEIFTLYSRYEEELKRSNSLDFDDLLLKTVELFENFPEVLERYQKRFKYIHVDEFQDTNALQFKLVKLLAGGYGNVFVVGDEDQSIYSWRGAEIKNILDFKKTYPQAKVYKLEQNYRSTTSILKAANNLIKNNANRNDKTLWSDISDEDSIEYYEAYNDRDEAEKVAKAIDVLAKNGSSYSDCAVLVRANSLTRQFEEEFNLNGIPYKVFGGFKFFERKEIKDALAYVRLAINPADSESLLRIINYPKRGIGDSSVEEIVRAATSHSVTVYEAIKQDLVPSLGKKLSEFVKLTQDLSDGLKTMRPSEFMQFAIRRSGLETFLASSPNPDDQNRLENINELVNAVAQFEKDNEGLGIEDFMQSVALVSDTDEMNDDSYVTIATVHAVKGLEFDNVFVVALEEGIFPTQRAITAGDIEEERRLMYVAITRARKKLFIINSRSRYRFGRTEYYAKSRFIGEMSGIKQSLRYSNSDYQTSFGGDRIKLGANNLGSQPFKRIDKRDAVKSDVNYDAFRRGVKVKHVKFGDGLIVETNGEGEDKIAAIMFKGLGIKRFALAIAASSLKIADDEEF